MTRIAIDVLLAIGVIAELLCSLGLLTAGDPLGRLHYAGAASTAGSAPIVVAVLIGQPFAGAGVKVLLTIIFAILAGAVLTGATARMAVLREGGREHLRELLR